MQGVIVLDDQFSRSRLIFNQAETDKIFASNIAVFGIGGVGSWCIEALVRAGVSNISLFDGDTVSISNLNRQLIALHSTVGQLKTEVMNQRILSINPNANVICHSVFYTTENSAEFDLSKFDYVIDAIDMVSSKIELIVQAKKCRTPIISSMGTGNKLDGSKFEIADIYKTSVCPLARVMRHELRKRGIDSLKVLYSKEEPVSVQCGSLSGKPVPGSASFVPPVAGMLIAGEVIRDISGVNKEL